MNTKCKDLRFEEHEEYTSSAEYFQIEDLKLDDFDKYVNLSKSEIIEIFNNLEEEAKKFSEEIADF